MSLNLGENERVHCLIGVTLARQALYETDIFYSEEIVTDRLRLTPGSARRLVNAAQLKFEAMCSDTRLFPFQTQFKLSAEACEQAGFFEEAVWCYQRLVEVVEGNLLRYCQARIKVIERKLELQTHYSARNPFGDLIEA